jgi:putative DNA methylase
MRFGHRPRVADPFCGSGQIPFEAARLGCDAYAADLSPVACMLTWGAFNIVGGPAGSREILERDQLALIATVQAEVNRLGVETDGNGWRGRGYVYCAEVRCPQTGWMVPLLPSRILSMDYSVVAELVPEPQAKRYDIVVRSSVAQHELAAAAKGTVRSDGRGRDSYLVHSVDGIEYRTKISTLRGDYRKPDGSNGNRLRLWEKGDFRPLPDDILQERLYAVLWTHSKTRGKGDQYEFRSVTHDDLERERVVEAYVRAHLADWQERGWVPDMRIEPGFNTDQPIRERGWTYWHHMFNARQLLIASFARRHVTARSAFGLTQLLNWNSRLTRWNGAATRGYGNTAPTFDNQALNTLFTYGTRATSSCDALLTPDYKHLPFEADVSANVRRLSSRARHLGPMITESAPPSSWAG